MFPHAESSLSVPKGLTTPMPVTTTRWPAEFPDKLLTWTNFWVMYKSLASNLLMYIVWFVNTMKCLSSLHAWIHALCADQNACLRIPLWVPKVKIQNRPSKRFNAQGFVQYSTQTLLRAWQMSIMQLAQARHGFWWRKPGKHHVNLNHSLVWPIGFCFTKKICTARIFSPAPL